MNKRILLSLVAVAVAACAEPLTPRSDSFDVVGNRASAKPRPPIQERAIIDGTGMTTLSVTSGSFAYFDESTRENVPAIPATGVLNHVHVKFCKNTYKDYGLNQFSANFHYSNVKIDSEADDEPDSPLDPDDKAHKQVNWDRSAASTILKGGGDGSFKFTGIPAGASLEVHYNYRDASGKNYSIKTCTTVLNAPDLAVEIVDWPSAVRANVPVVLTSNISVVSSSSVPATARCAIYENGVLLGKSTVINVSSRSGEYCIVTTTFSVGGTHNLQVRIEDIYPSDFVLTNNFANGSLSVAGGTVGGGGDGGGGQTGPSVPIVISDPTVWQGRVEMISKVAGVSVVNSWEDSQGAKLIVRLPFTTFAGPTSVTVSATTDGQVLLPVKTVSGNGPCVSGQEFEAYSYSIQLCSEGEDTYLLFQVNATRNSANRLAGTFVPYGSQITFNVSITSGGYKYSFPAGVLTTTVPAAISQTPCGTMLASLCPLSGEYRLRSDADAWLEHITSLTGVPYTP